MPKPEIEPELFTFRGLSSKRSSTRAAVYAICEQLSVWTKWKSANRSSTRAAVYAICEQLSVWTRWRSANRSSTKAAVYAICEIFYFILPKTNVFSESLGITPFLRNPLQQKMFVHYVQRGQPDQPASRPNKTRSLEAMSDINLFSHLTFCFIYTLLPL